MGTPDFAVESLKYLVENGKNVVAVITAPDKPAGRGQKIHETAVKKYAVSQNIPVLQPPKLKDPEFLKELASYKADLQVVVAFRMLPELVWAMPSKGTFNLHGSLLPQYRGAAPINWAIINGEIETGVTTFFIEKEIDTGKIIFSEKTPIGPNENAGDIHDRLMEIGGKLVLKTVNAIEKGAYPQVEQDHSAALKSAPKIFKEDCEIDWSKSAEEIHNFIRGMSPYPTAWTTLGDKTLKVFGSEIVESFDKENQKNDGISSDGKSFLQFKCGTGAINILVLQLEGKRRMNVKDFLAGYRF